MPLTAKLHTFSETNLKFIFAQTDENMFSENKERWSGEMRNFSIH